MPVPKSKIISSTGQSQANHTFWCETFCHAFFFEDQGKGPGLAHTPAPTRGLGVRGGGGGSTDDGVICLPPPKNQHHEMFLQPNRRVVFFELKKCNLWRKTHTDQNTYHLDPPHRKTASKNEPYSPNRCLPFLTNKISFGIQV